MTNVSRTNASWANDPNPFDQINFVNSGGIPNFSFLVYTEVGRKDGLRVGGRRIGGCEVVGLVGGFMMIMPHCDLILQAGTFQNLSLAEIPRWS